MQKVTRSYLRCLGMCLCVCGLPVASLASPILPATVLLDQSFDISWHDPVGGATVAATDALTGRIDLAQTFRVGLDGQLYGIELSAQQLRFALPGWTDGATFSVDLRRTVNGVPVEDDNAALASITVDWGYLPASGSFELSFFNFSPYRIDVAAGELLAIVLSADDGGLGNMYLQSDGSPHTNAFARNERGDAVWQAVPAADFSFRTYVQPVPEPATVLLVAGGLLGLKARRRRHARQEPTRG